ncbi:MAG: glycerophosphodiester phosphodiesterase [Chloroflexi bacterium]|nr:glycerophosphodiester phosphodiesterase [Chloroflexota bacterium]
MFFWFLKRTVLALLVAGTVWILYRMLTVEAPKPAKPFYHDLPQPTAYAHRGGAALWPENTLYAFQHAWELGVDVLELDVRGTRDGAIVVIHDPTVDRTTNGTGRVKDMTLADIQALDAGYRFTPDGGKTYPYRGQGIRIPTLEEVFDALPNARFNIEVKSNDPPIVDAVADLIRRKGMEDRVLIGAFDQKIAEALRRALPEAATFATEGEARAFWFWQKVHLPRVWRPVPDALQVPPTFPVKGYPVTVLSPYYVQAAHRLGVHVDVWTVDDPDEMARFLDMGVDGIMSDRPDVLLEVLRSRGLR